MSFRSLPLPLVLCAFCVQLPVFAQTTDADPVPAIESEHVHWEPLLEQSLFFIGVEHSFRLIAEPYTRSRLRGKFFPDWGRSIGNLHGWGDGDPFLINYVGHPMEGAVTGYLFIQNDPKSQKLQFGRNRDYWRGRAKATAFAFVSSELFELGPFSEATLGNAQRYFPQQGLVDHVITPTVGLVWIIGEDWIDKQIIQKIEAHTTNPYWKMLARGGLNPARSMANAMRLEKPWHRDNRPGLFGSNRTLLAAPNESNSADVSSSVATNARPALSDLWDGAVPRIELGVTYSYVQLAAGKPGTLSCNGGGATATYNFSSWFGLTADVGGCNMNSPGVNISGDSTNYLLGPRFTFRNRTPWLPFVQFLAGGDKLTTETLYPELEPPHRAHVGELERAALHSIYTTQQQTNAPAIEFGAGLNYVVNRPFAIRVLDVQDIHTWARSLNGTHYPNNIRFSTGIELRFGNW